MSRCQHNQKITKFCITPSCNHPLAGGCQYCFKRYHCHIGQAKFMTQVEVSDMIKYLTSVEDKKTKVRPLKESIYNYFNIIKGQISTYIDCLSSDLLNKISYPYIKKQGNLNILKKLKHKQYNKINPQQIIKMVEFKENNPLEKLQRNQILSYIEESRQVYKKVNAINSLYKQIQKQAEQSYLGESMMSVSIFYKKITDIYQHIQSEKQSILKKFQENLSKQKQSYPNEKDKLVKQLQTVKLQKFQNQHHHKIKHQKLIENQHKDKNMVTLPLQMKSEISKQFSLNLSQNKQQIRPRKVSIDSRCGELVRSRLKTYEQKQKQISERKQKLQQMMSKTEKKKTKDQDKSQSSSEKQNKTNSVVISLADNEISKNQNKDADLGAHRFLPEGKQQRKLYGMKQAVEKKTLKIPVNVIQQNAQDEQCQSPILRLKKSQKTKTALGTSGFQLGIFKVPQSIQVQNDVRSQPVQKGSQSSSYTSSNGSDKENFIPKNKNTIDMNLTEKQANSLILLVQSLNMSAKKAIPLLEASLKYSSHNFSAAQYLSFLYLQQNRPKECLKICNQALNLISGEANGVQISMHLYNNKAAALNILGRFSESIPILQKCIEVKKKDILFKNLGDAYFNLGITQKAIVNYENACVLNNQNHQALYNLAVCLYIQKNYDASKLKVQRALMLDNKNQNYLELYRQIITISQNK